MTNSGQIGIFILLLLGTSWKENNSAKQDIMLYALEQLEALESYSQKFRIYVLLEMETSFQRKTSLIHRKYRGMHKLFIEILVWHINLSNIHMSAKHVN